MSPNCAQTLDLLLRALELMDEERLHNVAARIAMAIDDLAGDGARADPTAIN